jgi:hypothetical protein
MDWQCPHHPNNWKYIGKERAMLSKGSKEPGTTRISQEIIAKQNASNAVDTSKSSQQTWVTPDNSRTTTPRTTQTTPKSTQATPARSQTGLRQHGQAQKARQGGTTGNQSEREVEMIDADSDEPSNE